MVVLDESSTTAREARVDDNWYIRAVFQTTSGSVIARQVLTSAELYGVNPTRCAVELLSLLFVR